MTIVNESSRVFIGTAGWNIPRDEKSQFPELGSHLQRYATRFMGVEINSSFYRPHQDATYARWGASVPSGFRFSVKIPRAITHQKRLKDAGVELEAFVAAAGHLEDRLGGFLVQLPPSLVLNLKEAASFFESFRRLSKAALFCEPRHQSWFTLDADRLLSRLQVARVAADPAICPATGLPGGWDESVYFRLHGSPRVYYSAYSAEYLDALSSRLLESARQNGQTWCIFDNTALGAATHNALELNDRLRRQSSQESPSVLRKS